LPLVPPLSCLQDSPQLKQSFATAWQRYFSHAVCALLEKADPHGGSSRFYRRALVANGSGGATSGGGGGGGDWGNSSSDDDGEEQRRRIRGRVGAGGRLGCCGVGADAAESSIKGWVLIQVYKSAVSSLIRFLVYKKKTGL
jgi:hypothetical protein